MTDSQKDERRAFWFMMAVFIMSGLSMVLAEYYGRFIAETKYEFIKNGEVIRTIVANSCNIIKKEYHYITECRIDGDRIIYSIPIEGTDYTMERIKK